MQLRETTINHQRVAKSIADNEKNIAIKIREQLGSHRFIVT